MMRSKVININHMLFGSALVFMIGFFYSSSAAAAPRANATYNHHTTTTVHHRGVRATRHPVAKASVASKHLAK